jgi:hypothetical protein
MGGTNGSLARIFSAGEGAFTVAEEFAFRERASRDAPLIGT